MNVSFTTIADRTESEFKDKNSKFYGIAVPFFEESELNGLLESLRQQFPKATHYCFAYRIGTDGTRFRANDDGEPSGSAGRPILAAIDSAGITSVLVVVVRYYGGTKLGVPGLIHAYRETARLAIEKAEKATKEYKCLYSLTFGYEDMGQILNEIKDLHIDILQKSFEDICVVHCSLPLSGHEEVIKKLKANILGISTDQVTDETHVPGCTIVYGGMSW